MDCEKQICIGNTTVHIGDCRESLRAMPEKSVHCCVTSPPYYGLRDYGVDGQLGAEETPEEYIGNLVGVFREVRRVLRDDGTLWLNLGDTHNAYNGNRGVSRSISAATDVATPKLPGGAGLLAKSLKNKDLVGIPWRVAFALQADGWWLRQDIIWSKPNPMPESVTDRCTKSHEYVFLMAKSERYFYDADAVKEAAVGDTTPNVEPLHLRDWSRQYVPGNTPLKRGSMGGDGTGTRNRRSVWQISTRPYRGAHFAVFPPALIEPCIKAGCPVGGTVLDPFGGSGTTGRVANDLGRNAVLCELNPKYVDLIRERLTAPAKPVKQKSETDKAIDSLGLSSEKRKIVRGWLKEGKATTCPTK